MNINNMNTEIISNKEKENKAETIKDDNSNNNCNDDSFNQLQALQLLIQKHSGLKELCKIINY